MGPGPRFEPESRDPQSRRITTYPTPANKCLFYVNEIYLIYDGRSNAGAGIRTLVGLRQQVLSLSPLASSGTPAKGRQKHHTIFIIIKPIKVLCSYHKKYI